MLHLEINSFRVLVAIAKEIDGVIEKLDITHLELRCSNADPKYGKLWFHSRSRPSDTRKVWEQVNTSFFV